MRGWTNGIVNFFSLAAGMKSCEDKNSGETLPFATCVACFSIIGEISDARTCLSVCATGFQRKFKEVVSYSKKILQSILYFVNYL